MVIHIEEYERGNIYTDTHGWSKSGWCATTDDREQWGKLLTVVDGENECGKFLFMKGWESEGQLNKDFLLTLIPGLQQRISDGDMRGLFVSDLYKQALKRMWELGYTKTCPRCGGTGHYSYNQIDGTRCFKCGGKKMVVQKVTKKLLAEMKKEGKIC